MNIETVFTRSKMVREKILGTSDQVLSDQNI